ncbi:TPA: cation-transporting P-type ATPase [Klebsiella pneumoniae]|nr:hypothetical protein [Klebsiella pneumoniae]
MEMPPENNVKGLSEAEVRARLAQYGYNEVREQPPGRKRAARTVLTGMCYSVGSATRQGSSSLTRFIGQSAMTSRT